ncbi:MAG: hypothetical protein H0X64_01520 [Gemmatimonadaceae bacterium]|nr:hypothetical protein [Gemmatimonadaceae bacterium]
MLNVIDHESMEPMEARENRNERKKPDGKPPGISRFSSLFYVAAIGGKKPRAHQLSGRT